MSQLQETNVVTLGERRMCQLGRMIMQIGSIDKSKLAKTDDEFLELVKSEVD
jgi:hypothetical protein